MIPIRRTAILGGGVKKIATPTFPTSFGSNLILNINMTDPDHPEYDNSGKGHTVTNYGATLVTGSNGNRLSFDGDNDKLQVNDASDLRLTNNFCFAIVFKPANLTQSEKYFFNKNTYTFLWEYVDNKVELFTPGATGDDPRSDSGITISDTNPHILICNYDGSVFSTYKDGSTVYTGNKTFTLSTGGDPLYIGSAGNSNFCNCQLGDVIIVDRAATASELSQLNQFLAWKHGITI